MKVKIEAEDCIGCGLCTQICSDVFEMAEDKAIVLQETVPEGKEEDIKDSVESCPTDAILIID